jgi:dihydroxyacetone kinase-like protein
VKKLINRPIDYVDEMLEGLTRAYPALVLCGDNRRTVRRREPARPGKVGVVSGGGSGHLPLFTGYVGPGLLDACSIGNVFEGPNVGSCVDAIRAANGGAGVLLLYGNYGGDRMNFDMAAEMLEAEQINTATVVGVDDIASAPADSVHKRRGVAGIIYAYKIAGASAESGASLDAVRAVADKAVTRTRSIGAAIGSGQVPGAAKPSFELADDEIEMGIGIHGEPGIWRDKLKPIDAIVDEMIERLIAERPPGSDGRVSILVNSLGATPLEELFIIYRRAHTVLATHGLRVVRPLVGAFVTSMEMKGMSISLNFLDDELETLLAAPAECPFWRVG